jgi:hypothetical protein
MSIFYDADPLEPAHTRPPPAARACRQLLQLVNKRASKTMPSAAMLDKRS